MKRIQPFLLLILGGACMALSNGKFLIAPAAWIFPLLLMFAVKDLKVKVAWFMLTVVTAAANQISFHNMLPSLAIPMFAYIPSLAGSLYALPYVFQKLIYRYTHSFRATLIFPCTYALLDYLNVYLNPYGTFGVLGYSQHGFLPMIQVASVLGVTGITFVIMWTASIVYWLRLEPLQTKQRKIAIVTATVLGLALIGGGLRVALPSDVDTVPVSGIHTFDRNDEATLEIFDLHNQNGTDFHEKATERMDALVEKTVMEAEAGAKIIHHSEGAVVIDQSQKSAYLNRVKKVANEWGVYIVTVPYIFTAEGAPNENVLYIIDPNGEVALEHYKVGGNLVEKTVLGDGELQVIDTPYGRISAVICWDKDFPLLMDQVGEKDVDLLFIPSADWKEISPYHTMVGNVRGVENGAHVVTQTVNGLSMIANDKGETLAKMDHFTTDHWVMRGHVPKKGSDTPYTLWGKYTAAYIILILIITTLSIYVRNKREGRSGKENE